MTTPKLLPCPFCGGDARNDAHADGCYFVLHRKLNKAPDADLSLHMEVLAAWNRRAPQAVAGGEPVHQFRKKHCADWYDGRADHRDGGGPYEERTLYTAPPTTLHRKPCWNLEGDSQ
jgi:hypothetical protein